MMMTEARFNLNNHVRVKLTDLGRARHEKYWRGLMGDQYEYRAPAEDADGWSRWQMHDLMHVFGPMMTTGMHIPFETEIIIEDLKEMESA